MGRRGARRTARRTSRRTSRRVSRRQGAASGAAAPPPEAPAAPAAPIAAEPEGKDPYEQLKEAKELLDAGILTEEEFAAEKAKILGE